MKHAHQIFGSKNSLDLDVCFFVKALSSIDNNHKKVETLVQEQAFKTTKTVNANLAIIKDGVVVDCFKGIVDELNNALYKTYHLHEQEHGNKIKLLLPRNVEFRKERCARLLVSYFTRTELRSEAKIALKGTLSDKLLFLERLNLNEFTTFGKHGSKIEIYKSMAFQLGITLALIQGVELYTKEGVIEQFPELRFYILRAKHNTKALEQHLKLFVLLAKENG